MPTPTRSPVAQRPFGPGGGQRRVHLRPSPEAVHGPDPFGRRPISGFLRKESRREASPSGFRPPPLVPGLFSFRARVILLANGPTRPTPRLPVAGQVPTFPHPEPPLLLSFGRSRGKELGAQPFLYPASGPPKPGGRKNLAQPFMAGEPGQEVHESRPGRKKALGLALAFFRPCGAGCCFGLGHPPLKRWAMVGRPYGTIWRGRPEPIRRPPAYCLQPSIVCPPSSALRRMTTFVQQLKR
jgi:hypothetical protein